MSEKQAKLYKLHDHITGDVVYLNGYTKAGVRAFHVEDRFVVDLLSVKEALTLDPKDIIDATADPQQQVLSGVPAP